MGKSAFILLLQFFVISTGLAQSTIQHNNKDYFINGINIPWNHFGSDIGSHDEWGNLYSRSYFEEFFKSCRNQGVNTARWWLHCDGRSNPEFNMGGEVVGLDSNFIEQFNEVNNIAENFGVMLMPCLWSFDMLKDYTSGAGIYAGLHQDLIEDDSKTKTYIENALIPFIKGIEQPCNILAIDIINEAEWGIKSSVGAGVKIGVSSKDMQRFVGRIAAAIHRHSDIKTTLGSTSLNFVSAVDPANNLLWSDAQLLRATNDNQAYLDFYQIHYYDWMYWKSWNPFLLNYDYWQLDKPCIIGEYPAADGIYSAEQMIQLSFDKKWAGHMPWSYSAKDGEGEWDNVIDAIKALAEEQEELTTNIVCNPTMNTDDFFVSNLDLYSTSMEWIIDKSEQLSSVTLYRSSDSSMQSNTSIYQSKNVMSGQHKFVDVQPPSGYNYYQLKKTRKDGGFYYSLVRSIFVPTKADGLFTISPNPASNHVSIEYFQEESAPTHIEIYNLFGKSIIDDTQVFVKGINEISIDLSSLSNGTYYLKINHDLKPFAKADF